MTRLLTRTRNPVNRRSWTFAAASVLLGLAVSACGSSAAPTAPASGIAPPSSASAAPSSASSAPSTAPATSASASPAAGGGSQALTPVSMVLTYHQGFQAPVYWGVQNGAFKKYGIDLQISSPSGAQAPTNITYVSQGKFDVGYVGSFQLPVYKQKYGDDVIAFFGWMQRNPACLIVRENSGINSVSDLAGKTIAINAGTGKDQLVAMLEHYGVKGSSVHIQEVSPSTTTGLYIAGKVDAVEQYANAVLPLFQEQGVPSRPFCLYDAGLDYEANGFGATSAYMKGHKPVMQGLTKGLIDVFNYAHDHPDTVAQSFTQQFGSASGSAAVVRGEIEQTFPFMRTPNNQGHPYGWMSDKDWAQTLKYDETYYQLKSGLDPKAFYTNEFFPQ